ncbi:MFS transporter [Streptomyces sp. NBC_01795]|uniref:MFS transporter n=1 Tax=unclassified Streptomyces TaxID=2593676 RepID=UPI002DD7F257|nr:MULTISPECIES: MFS transporter [unclassified Streptomyces]WSA96218.1 MFS transporter [Streptomyces sp. NBC_01795]WSS11158.1 MFS transporter [Streptomyces sp. NBC_01186]
MAAANSSSRPADAPLRSLIPARVDRMPWSGFHTKMIAALGCAWILDGLEITVASSVTSILTNEDTLGLSSSEAGLIATVYLIGQVLGALFFGRMADRFGRRKLFLLTFGVYMFGSGLTALTFGQGPGWDAYLYLTRFIAGAGIGGEYAAINSAIQEMMPARFRGRVDLLVNGTYWAGAIVGTIAELLILGHFDDGTAWRIGFLLGPVLGFSVLFVRRNLPESPRWLIMNGRETEAEEAISRIEEAVLKHGKTLPPVDENAGIEISESAHSTYLTLLRVLFKQYPQRAVLASTLMITQSFLYNAIFFTYTLVLTKFYGVPDDRAPMYLLAFAAGNLVGPIALGPLFDIVGRRRMIAGTYLFSGCALGVTATLFVADVLTAFTQTTAWCVIFFFASAGASSGYLTAGEIFPLEVRGKAIALFFAIGQGAGASGPYLYGWLIGDGSDRGRLFIGFLLGAAIMIVGGLAEVFLGVDAERKPLEAVAKPLSVVRTSVSAAKRGTARRLKKPDDGPSSGTSPV